MEDDLAEHLKGPHVESGQNRIRNTGFDEMTFLEKIEQISNQINGLQDR
jgi:hypothetical protein